VSNLLNPDSIIKRSDEDFQGALSVTVILPFSLDDERDIPYSTAGGDGNCNGFAALIDPVTTSGFAVLNDFVDGIGEGVVGRHRVDVGVADAPQLAHTDIRDATKAPSGAGTIQRGGHRFVAARGVVDFIIEV